VCACRLKDEENGGTMVASGTNSFEDDAAGVLGQSPQEESEDEKRNDRFHGFGGFQYFSICRDEHRSRWRHDGWGVGMGNELRMAFHDHHRGSRYYWHRLYDETKVEILKGNNISYQTIPGASCFFHR
jgi:hypothetical protein